MLHIHSPSWQGTCIYPLMIRLQSASYYNEYSPVIKSPYGGLINQVCREVPEPLTWWLDCVPEIATAQRHIYSQESPWRHSSEGEFNHYLGLAISWLLLRIWLIASILVLYGIQESFHCKKDIIYCLLIIAESSMSSSHFCLLLFGSASIDTWKKNKLSTCFEGCMHVFSPDAHSSLYKLVQFIVTSWYEASNIMKQ